MSIAYDNGLQTVVNAATTSVTRPFLLTGTDRFLNTWALVTAGGGITGVTYNGVSLTKTGTVTPQTITCDCYTLQAPDSGTNNVIWSCGSSTTFVTTATSYTGVKQSFTPNAGTNTGTGNPATGSLTTGVNNSWIIWNMRNNGFDPDASGTNWTRRTTSPGNGMYIGDTNAAITPAGATSVSVNQISSDTYGFVKVEIEPSAASSVNSNFLAFI